jgi:hypothetical protein
VRAQIACRRDEHRPYRPADIVVKGALEHFTTESRGVRLEVTNKSAVR